MQPSPIFTNDKKARLIGVPLVAVLATLVHHKSSFFNFDKPIFIGLGLSLLNTIFIWEGIRQLLFYVRVKYPNINNTRSRLIVQTLVSIVYTFLITLFLDSFCGIFGQEKPAIPFLSFYIGVGATFIITLLYESVFYFQSWKQNLQETEALAREHIQSQLESLKSQLDPHFLFNTLNTLSFLIADNAEAQKYLERLSDVYRYVLLNRDKNTVSLDDEMDFVEAYMYLNKIRFKENLLVENHLSVASHHHKVIPLSVQMLVENAIKHNIISKDKPLKIIISEKEDYLVVENNFQEKKTLEKSTKIGLSNIHNRYKLITPRLMRVEQDERVFRVALPLL